MAEFKYRICRVCGKQWNVSVLSENTKHYICPRCSWKTYCKRGEKNGKIRGGIYD